MHIDNLDITIPPANASGEKFVIRRDWRWRDTLWEMKYLAKARYNRLSQRWTDFRRKHWLLNLLLELISFVVVAIMGAVTLLGIYIIFFWQQPV